MNNNKYIAPKFVSNVRACHETPINIGFRACVQNK